MSKNTQLWTESRSATRTGVGNWAKRQEFAVRGHPYQSGHRATVEMPEREL